VSRRALAAVVTGLQIADSDGSRSSRCSSSQASGIEWVRDITKSCCWGSADACGECRSRVGALSRLSRGGPLTSEPPLLEQPRRRVCLLVTTCSCPLATPPIGRPFDRWRVAAAPVDTQGTVLSGLGSAPSNQHSRNGRCAGCRFGVSPCSSLHLASLKGSGAAGGGGRPNRSGGEWHESLTGCMTVTVVGPQWPA
jgi:hypothetical protein